MALDAALPRHPRARRRGIRERHVRRRYAHVDGDRPRRARVGGGLVRAATAGCPSTRRRGAASSRRAYSVSSPGFHASSAARIVGGVAASRLNTAALHQDVSFGDKDVTFAGTDIRPASPSPGGAFGLQHRGGSLGKLLRVPACARGRARRADARRFAGTCATRRRILAARQRRAAPTCVTSSPTRESASTRVSRRRSSSALLRTELAVDGEEFASALAAARFGPPADAPAAAARARAELARLRASVRKRLGVVRRARGLVSLRSLGFAE